MNFSHEINLDKYIIYIDTINMYLDLFINDMKKIYDTFIIFDF